MLNLLLKNGTVYYQGKMQKVDVLIQNGIVCKIDRDIQADVKRRVRENGGS